MTSRRLRTLFEVGSPSALTDGQLLERFATREGEAGELAFEALVERHGSMVLRACRGILRDDHEAMDAFQATFLVLARKGRGLWVGDSLGPWLHRVACRAASKARANALRRRALEARWAERGALREDFERPADHDLAAILHEELDRLPERYRAAIVLCDLQGYTAEETARRLGCAVGTVGSRLSRGRDRLRARLTRRGLAPTAGLIAACLTREAIGAVMPPALVHVTIQGVLAFSSGKATIGASSAAVALLVEEITRSLFMTQIRSTALIIAVACGSSLVAGGTIRVFARFQDPAEIKPPAPAVARSETRQKPTPFEQRHENYRFATIGNFFTPPPIPGTNAVPLMSREAILYRDGSAMLFDLPARQRIDGLSEGPTIPIVPTLRHEGPIRELKFFEEDRRLLVTTSETSVKIWEALSGELKKAIDGQFLRPLAFGRSLEDGRFATVDGAGKVVRLWDSKSLELVGTIRPESSSRLIGAGLSRDGQTLAAISEDHSVTLIDTVTGKPFATLRPPTPPVIRVFLDDIVEHDAPALQLDDRFWDGVKVLIPNPGGQTPKE